LVRIKTFTVVFLDCSVEDEDGTTFLFEEAEDAAPAPEGEELRPASIDDFLNPTDTTNYN